MRIENGRTGAGHGEPDWRLLDGNGERTTRRHVNFSSPFAENPRVIVSLCMFDILDGQNHRLDVYPEGVDRDGFEVVFKTWADTRVWAVRVEWVAIGR